MLQRTGSGPITRKVLIVDSGLAGTDTASRRVRALADELGARNIAVTEAISYDDGLATVVSDTSIHCILLNWTQSGSDASAVGEATELLRTVRKRNAKIPIFLMASRAVSGTLSVEVMTLADEFIWILDDTPTFISGRVQGAIER
jgi:arginine decarboxylase